MGKNGREKCNQLIEKREKRVTIGNASGLIEPDWLEILRGFLLFFFFFTHFYCRIQKSEAASLMARKMSGKI